MKLKEVLDKTVQFFKEKNIETPRLDAEILLASALKLKSRVDLYMKYDQPLAEDELVACREFVKRRSQGEPVAYITGEKGFYNFDFLVNKSVLIPRPETELIVETALDWIETNRIEKPKILDLGTGSGCIIISLLKKIPDALGIAVEKSVDAVQVAQENAKRLGVSDRLQIQLLDAIDAKFSSETFDLIVSNPPYIAKDDNRVEKDVKAFEPNSALYAEEKGLADLFKWSTIASPWLKKKSMMIFEMGFEQGPEMQGHFEKLASFQKNKILKDLSGHDRIIVGEKNG